MDDCVSGLKYVSGLISIEEMKVCSYSTVTNDIYLEGKLCEYYKL